MTDHQPDLPQINPSTKSTPTKRKRGWLWRVSSALILLFILVILVLVGSAIWLVGSEKGLRYALTLPEKFQLGVAIQTDSLQGSLWHGFSAQGVTVKTESADIAATSLKLKWQPTELIKLHHLHINELIAGDVHIQDKPTPPKPKSEPLTLPENLSLPFTAAIDKLQVGKITQGKKNTVWLHHVHASYVYDHKKHFLNIPSVKTDWTDSSGSFSLVNQTPYALTGKLASQGVLTVFKWIIV